jgi:hypothetical protein
MCSCERPEFYKEKMVKGRKEYRCVECGSLIRKGELHQVTTGKWDTDVMHFRQCAPCHQVMEDCLEYAESPCDVNFGEIDEWVSEMQRDDLAADVVERFDAFTERLLKSRDKATCQ